MSVKLKDGEKIEDLQYKGLQIIQNRTGFRFGTDSILLAGFARASRSDRVVDLGSGTGVIAMLLAARTGAELTEVEIQSEQADMARRSAELNGQIIDVITADMRNAHELLGRGRFDAAVCNPPYHSAKGGQISQKGEGVFAGAATHDLYCDISEVCRSAERLLKYGGKLFLCCPCERLAETFGAMTAAMIEPKRLRLVAANEQKAPYLSLIEGKKGAAHGLIVEKQLNLAEPDGSDTPEVRRIYHKDE